MNTNQLQVPEADAIAEVAKGEVYFERTGRFVKTLKAATKEELLDFITLLITAAEKATHQAQGSVDLLEKVLGWQDPE